MNWIDKFMIDQPCTEARKTALLEDLAALEHEQWKAWSMDILDTEKICEPRAKRWLEIYKYGGYRNLPEDLKDKDREWAERILWIVKKHLGIK